MQFSPPSLLPPLIHPSPVAKLWLIQIVANSSPARERELGVIDAARGRGGAGRGMGRSGAGRRVPMTERGALRAARGRAAAARACAGARSGAAEPAWCKRRRPSVVRAGRSGAGAGACAGQRTWRARTWARPWRGGAEQMGRRRWRRNEKDRGEEKKKIYRKNRGEAERTEAKEQCRRAG